MCVGLQEVCEALMAWVEFGDLTVTVQRFKRPPLNFVGVFS